MEELIKLMTEKVGLSGDVAKNAVDVVVGHLKSKLPGPVASCLTSFLEGGQGAAGAVSGLAGKIGGMLGGDSKQA